MVALCITYHLLDCLVVAFFLNHSNEDIANFFQIWDLGITLLTAETPSIESCDHSEQRKHAFLWVLLDQALHASSFVERDCTAHQFVSSTRISNKFSRKRSWKKSSAVPSSGIREVAPLCCVKSQTCTGTRWLTKCLQQFLLLNRYHCRNISRNSRNIRLVTR